MSRTTANLLLLVTACIWGCTFVAQATAMRHVGPVTFTGMRFLLSAAVVLPFALAERRQAVAGAREGAQSGAAGTLAMLALVFLGGQITQQIGIAGTSVTNAGFLTALYVILVPIFGIGLYRQWPPAIVWPAAALALVGTWLLGGGLDGLRAGDLWVLASAVFWGLQVVLLGRVVERTGRPFSAVFWQSLAGGVAALALALAVERIEVAGMLAVWPEVLISGGLSGGIAFSLQAVAQRHTGAADAAVVFSSEAVFAALAAALWLGERPTLQGWLGCALILLAVLGVQVWPLLRPVRTAAAMGP